ncbi:hypothetical protein [Yinghuangia soli]|uniref:Uncharacterized protein n=1 Tax=Yinghuangia soli TaxID=2908204 RepID=A0AA41Q8Q0_9ACTN|nr:hypothetical protein [Yinghuangia soli]MCF2532806.1 hypothetical protein [Yinghuangia soli]
MNQVGQHLGNTVRSALGTPARLLRALVHGDPRDRDPATWALAAVLTLAWWAGLAWLLAADDPAGSPATGAMLLGGWSLTLLPVHCARRFRLGARRETGPAGPAHALPAYPAYPETPPPGPWSGPGDAEGAVRE